MIGQDPTLPFDLLRQPTVQMERRQSNWLQQFFIKMKTINDAIRRNMTICNEYTRQNTDKNSKIRQLQLGDWVKLKKGARDLKSELSFHAQAPIA